MLKFAMLIDYANLINSYMIMFKGKKEIELQNIMKKSISKIEEYAKDIYQEEVKFEEKVAFILPEFKDPTEQFLDENIKVIKVNDNTNKKERRVESRDDDRQLAIYAYDLLDKDIDGILILSNDGGFKEIGEQIKAKGRYFWTGLVNYKGKLFGNPKLRYISDKVLPIYEIISGIDYDVETVIQQEPVENTCEKWLEIYYENRLIQTFPLNDIKNNISIGRKSVNRKILPDIDLTFYDKEKIISREHCEIKVTEYHVNLKVNKNCKSGTWYKVEPMKPGMSFSIKKNEPITLGRPDGFVVVYRKKYEGR